MQSRSIKFYFILSTAFLEAKTYLSVFYILMYFIWIVENQVLILSRIHITYDKNLAKKETKTIGKT